MSILLMFWKIKKSGKLSALDLRQLSLDLSHQLSIFPPLVGGAFAPGGTGKAGINFKKGHVSYLWDLFLAQTATYRPFNSFICIYVTAI